LDVLEYSVVDARPDDEIKLSSTQDTKRIWLSLTSTLFLASSGHDIKSCAL